MIQIKPEIFQEVLSAYDLGEGTITYKAYGEGHINNTSSQNAVEIQNVKP